MRKSFKVLTLTLIISGLLVSGVFITNMIHAATNGGGGTGTLSGLWANVYVGGLTYEPFFGWTQSDHSFDITNMTDDAVSYTYEFQHGVWEILQKNAQGEVTLSRFVNTSTQFLTRTVGPPTWYDELNGTQGVDCSGEDEGLYWIQAYTSVQASILGGSLDVRADEDTEFVIFEDD